MRERQRAKQPVASILSTFWEMKQFNTFINDSKICTLVTLKRLSRVSFYHQVVKTVFLCVCVCVCVCVHACVRACVRAFQKVENYKVFNMLTVERSHWFPQYFFSILIPKSMTVFGYTHSSKCFCSTKKKSGISGRWLNDDNIFGWASPLSNFSIFLSHYSSLYEWHLKYYKFYFKCLI